MNTTQLNPHNVAKVDFWTVNFTSRLYKYSVTMNDGTNLRIRSNAELNETFGIEFPVYGNLNDFYTHGPVAFPNAELIDSEFDVS